MIERKWIEHAGLRIDFDRSIPRIPAGITGFFLDQASRDSVGLTAIIASVAPNHRAYVQRNHDNQQPGDLGLEHLILRNLV